jgi:hypothetical protein
MKRIDTSPVEKGLTLPIFPIITDALSDAKPMQFFKLILSIFLNTSAIERNISFAVAEFTSTRAKWQSLTLFKLSLKKLTAMTKDFLVDTSVVSSINYRKF